MGLRFRRSLKLFPGLRLNFSLGGVSATLGGRGASVNLGKRGSFMNLGLPGTGMSFRSQLSSGSNSFQPIFTSTRASERWQKHQQRDALRALAEEAHEEREEQLDALRGILRHRNQTPLDWELEFASKGVYQPIPFEEPKPDFTLASVSSDVERDNSIFPWITWVSVCLGTFLIAPQTWIRILAGLVLSYSLHNLVVFVRERPREIKRVYVKRRQAFAKASQEARSAYQASEFQRAAAFEQEETLREHMRTAVSRYDAEAITEFLTVELSNEDLPIEVDSAVSFDGNLSAPTIELSLPGIEVIPLTTTRVTKTGKLSERRMAQGDRVELYKTVCAALCLRLVHECFRVLPFVTEVTLLAVVDVDNPLGTTPDHREVVHVVLSRERFEAIDLNYEPTVCLYHLGVDLRCTREGHWR